MRFAIYDLQDHNAAAHLNLFTNNISVEYYVIVDGVVINMPFEFAVPLEVFAGGRKDNLAPTVVNVNPEIIVLHLVKRTFWNTEIVVQAVTVRGEGVGKYQRVWTR